MTIGLKNLSRTHQTLNLTREVAPVRAVYRRSVTMRDGGEEMRDVRIVHGDSITLLVGETRGGLSNAVRFCPEVVAAVAAKRIAIIDEEEPTDAAPVDAMNETAAAPAESTPVPEPASGGRKASKAG